MRIAWPQERGAAPRFDAPDRDDNRLLWVLGVLALLAVAASGWWALRAPATGRLGTAPADVAAEYGGAQSAAFAPVQLRGLATAIAADRISLGLEAFPVLQAVQTIVPFSPTPTEPPDDALRQGPRPVYIPFVPDTPTPQRDNDVGDVAVVAEEPHPASRVAAPSRSLSRFASISVAPAVNAMPVSAPLL